MGTPALAVPTLATLANTHAIAAVVTQPDRPSGRGRRTAQSPVKRWAVDNGVPVLQPERLGDDGVEPQLRAFEVDAAVVVAFGQLLPPSILALPRLGCVNLHASLLPRHRGASPIQAAILAGDRESGVTTMLMDEGLDTGPVLLQRRIELDPGETSGTLGAKLSELGAALTTETIDRLALGELEPHSQDATLATMTKLIRKTDGAIDWRLPADSIERQVRAMQPWPVAHTVLAGDVLRIWNASPAPSDANGAPGVVLESEGRLVVACGDGCLELLEVQRPGGRRLPASDFLRGYDISAGTTLGGDRD